MAYQGKTDWTYGDIVTEQDMNRIEHGVQDAYDSLEEHKEDSDKHVTAAERNNWNAKETESGAQAKANAAEQRARGASVNKIAVYDGNQIDPNTTTDSYIVTRHNNGPIANAFYHIHTFFYANTSDSRAQMAIRYSGGDDMFIRHFFDGTWSSWKRLWSTASDGDSSRIDGHINNNSSHITANERNNWNAKETTSGAQTKANQAETNAKNASLPRTGGTITGNLYGNGSQNHFRNLAANSGYFDIDSYSGTYGSGKMRTFYDANSRSWNIESRTDTNGHAPGLRITFDMSSGQPPSILTHTGSPEGHIAANPGSICLGKNGVLYVKQSGTGNAGWLSK